MSRLSSIAATVGLIMGVMALPQARSAAADAAPARVEVAKLPAGGFRLDVNGQPFFVQGAGGGASKRLLKEAGGNAFRTWGVDGIDRQLDEAQALGLKVAVGLWLEHERHGFSYQDPQRVAAQREKLQAVIRKYKDHPAVLLWGIGNEMEGYGSGDDPAIWNAVEEIAAFAHRLDPNHPTMTVIAEVGGGRVEAIHKHCPDIDIVGINSYGGLPSIPERYRAAGGTKPYLVTEFGPLGTWEMPKTEWGAVPEPTSTQKAAHYRQSYQAGVLAERDKLCLGAFAFFWGCKQEATSTWFSMLLPDGTRLAAVDTMQELWSGKPPANRVPTIEPLVVPSPKLRPGQTLKLSLRTEDPEHDPLSAEWTLAEEVAAYGVGGDPEAAPPTIKDAIVAGDVEGATVKIPAQPGRYRLFVTVRDDHNGAATANVPLLVEGNTSP